MIESFLNQVTQGDCLEAIRDLPDNSVDLICTDPPYFKVKSKSESVFNWWDSQWSKSTEFLRWLDSIAEQWQRILKPNGSLYCFASPRMAAQVEVMLGGRFNVINRITWQKPPFSTKAEMVIKEDLRRFFSASEAIVFCEHYGADNAAKSEAGYWQECGKLRQKVFGQVFGEYLAAEFDRAGVTRKEISALFPSASGGLTGCVSNWVLGSNCPSKEQYEKIRDYLNLLPTGTADYLRSQYEDLRSQYEDLRRPFFVTADVPYTDVWSFPTVQAYPGKHPCEKPLPLLEHVVNVSSRPNAVVLDCFAGSGNTLVAAKKLGRRYIGIEIDPHWVSVASHKLGSFEMTGISFEERSQWLKAATGIDQVTEKDAGGQLSLLEDIA